MPEANSTTDVVVRDQRRTSWRAWVASVGIGVALLPAMVHYFMKQNAELVKEAIQQGKDGSAALFEAADSMDDLSEDIGELTTEVGGLVQSQGDLASDLAPLIRQLDRVADAVQQQTAQQQSQEASQ